MLVLSDDSSQPSSKRALTGSLFSIPSGGQLLSHILLIALPSSFLLHSVMHIAIRLVFLWCLLNHSFAQNFPATLLHPDENPDFLVQPWHMLWEANYGESGRYPHILPDYTNCLTIFWPWAISVASHTATKSVKATEAWLPWHRLLPRRKGPVC